MYQSFRHSFHDLYGTERSFHVNLSATSSSFCGFIDNLHIDTGPLDLQTHTTSSPLGALGKGMRDDSGTQGISRDTLDYFYHFLEYFSPHSLIFELLSTYLQRLLYFAQFLLLLFCQVFQFGLKNLNSKVQGSVR